MADKLPPAAHSGTFQVGGDLPVHRLGFGAMRITGQGIWGEPEDRDEAIRVLRRSLELGIDFIDTADSYGPEVSERLIAEALYPYPKGLVIATKAGFRRPGPNQWVEDGRPEYLRGQVESSLRRLRLERIDLLQLHRIDPKVPLEDQLGALDATTRGREDPPSGPLGGDRCPDRGGPPVGHHRHRSEPLQPGQSEERRRARLQRGGGHRIHSVVPARDRRSRPGRRAARPPRRRLHATPSQVALAWLLHRSPVMLPIPGTSRVKHLEENTAAALLELDEETLRALDLQTV